MTSDVATLILITIVTIMIIPVLSRGVKFGYYLLHAIFKIGVAMIIASIIVGLTKENLYVKYLSNILNYFLSFLGLSDLNNIHVEVPEQAKNTARSILKDGVIKILNYI